MTSPAAADQPNPLGANISNWRNAPFSQWAFHNIGAIIPTAGIAAGPNAPTRLPAAPMTFETFRIAAGGGASLSLTDVLAATATDGIVILHDGRIVYEFYDHGTTAGTPHILMSATKSVVGLMAGILHDMGQLDIEAPVSDYVPEIAATAYRGATIRQLLDMRTGVVLDDAQQRVYAAATGWEPAPVDGGATDLHAFYQRMTLPYAAHGGPFRYVSANTDLLGWAIERATGQTFADLVSDLLWRPMGAEHDASITVDPKGAPRCTGGFCATVQDFARIGELVVNNGSRGRAQIISRDWLDDIADGGDLDAWAKGEWGKAFSFIGARLRYRSGWYVVDDEPKLLFAMGIHGQNLFVDRANRLVIAKVSSQNNPIDTRAFPLTHMMVAEIRRCLLEATQ